MKRVNNYHGVFGSLGFGGSCEVHADGWFQPASEIGSMKINQIAKLFSLSHVQYKQAGLSSTLLW